jgi:hypothetical protein
MTTRPDLAAIVTRNNARKRGDSAVADIRALLVWIDCLEAQLRAGAEWRQVTGGLNERAGERVPDWTRCGR